MTQPVTLQCDMELALTILPHALAAAIDLGSDDRIGVQMILPTSFEDSVNRAFNPTAPASVYRWDANQEPQAISTGRLQIVARLSTELDRSASLPDDHKPGDDEGWEATRLRA